MKITLISAVFGFLFACASPETTQEVFTEEDNYHDYQYYNGPTDPLTEFDRDYDRPVFQEPEVYYDDVQQQQQQEEEEEQIVPEAYLPQEQVEPEEEVEVEGPRDYLYPEAPGNEAPSEKSGSDWFFEDY